MQDDPDFPNFIDFKIGGKGLLCPFCLDTHNGCKCNTEELLKLSRLITKMTRRFYARYRDGEYYTCSYINDTRQRCERHISNKTVEKTNGQVLDSNDNNYRSFCSKHVPRCYLLPDGCENFEICCDFCDEEVCGDCYRNSCQTQYS
jgi:hypothetical protein